MPRPSKTTAAGDSAGDGQAGTAVGPTINGIVPTQLETRFAFALVSQFRSKPEVDWDQVAAVMGLSKKSAIERWRLIRNKFGITFNEEAGDGAAETPGSTRKGRKSTAATKTPQGDGEDEIKEDQEAAPITPVKRGRKPGTGKKTTTTTPGSATGGGRKRRAGSANVTATASGSLGEGDDNDAEEQDGAAAAGSPAKKIKGGKAALPATRAVTSPGITSTTGPADTHESSPLSSVPGMTADEGSGDEMEV